MRKRKTLLGVGIFLAVLVLGIGYAAISDVTLIIKGSATASANEDNFAVSFDVDTDITTEKGNDTYTTSTDAIKITAKYSGEVTATFEVTGLSTMGDYAFITYAVHNESPELAANLSAEITTSDTFDQDYFATNYFFTYNGTTTDTIELAAGDSATITVLVAMNKTTWEDISTGDITVTLTASPVIPNSSTS